MQHTTKHLILVTLLLLSYALHGQGTKAERQVQNLLEQQVEDWNAGDLEAFMKGYWQSDDLIFMSSRGIREGYDALLNGYRRGYPDAAKMGHLSFEDLDIRQQSRRVVTVHGRFIQVPAGEDAQPSKGYFLLVAKRIKGRWSIIYDHTSVEE